MAASVVDTLILSTANWGAEGIDIDRSGYIGCHSWDQGGTLATFAPEGTSTLVQHAPTQKHHAGSNLFATSSGGRVLSCLPGCVGSANPNFDCSTNVCKLLVLLQHLLPTVPDTCWAPVALWCTHMTDALHAMTLMFLSTPASKSAGCL